MDNLVLDNLFADLMFGEEKEELQVGKYEMTIAKIKNGETKNGTPFVDVVCEKDSQNYHVNYYFSDKAKAFSLEKLVKLSKKLTGKFTYQKNLDLDTLCEVLQTLVGKPVTVQIKEKDGFINNHIVGA